MGSLQLVSEPFSDTEIRGSTQQSQGINSQLQQIMKMLETVKERLEDLFHSVQANSIAIANIKKNQEEELLSVSQLASTPQMGSLQSQRYDFDLPADGDQALPAPTHQNDDFAAGEDVVTGDHGSDNPHSMDTYGFSSSPKPDFTPLPFESSGTKLNGNGKPYDIDGKSEDIFTAPETNKAQNIEREKLYLANQEKDLTMPQKSCVHHEQSTALGEFIRIKTQLGGFMRIKKHLGEIIGSRKQICELTKIKKQIQLDNREIFDPGGGTVGSILKIKNLQENSARLNLIQVPDSDIGPHFGDLIQCLFAGCCPCFWYIPP